MQHLNVDFCPRTGRNIYGEDAIKAAILQIVKTPIGARVRREEFGTTIPPKLGRENLSDPLLLSIITEIAAAIDLHEKRFRLHKIMPIQADRAGRLGLRLMGYFRPRALLGDMTEGPLRTFEI